MLSCCLVFSLYSCENPSKIESAHGQAASSGRHHTVVCEPLRFHCYSLCRTKKVSNGSPPSLISVQAVHSMNSNCPGVFPSLARYAQPKFFRVISRSQRLQTGGLVWKRIPPATDAGRYSMSPAVLQAMISCLCGGFSQPSGPMAQRFPSVGRSHTSWQTARLYS